MANQPLRRNPRERETPFIALLLQAIAFLLIIIAVFGLPILFAFKAERTPALEPTFVAVVLGSFLLCLIMAGVFLSLAAMIRLGYAQIAGQHATRSSNSLANGFETLPADAAESEALSPSEEASADLVISLLRETGDLDLLKPEDRDAARDRLHTRLHRLAAEAVVDAINRRQLGKARMMLRDTEARYGSTPTLERLATKIEEAAIRQEPLDFASTRRKVDDSMLAGNWDRAERLAQTAWFNHPESARIRQLWDDTRRSRLFAHIQSCAAEHNWAESLAAAQEFLHRFADSPEAENLRDQIETLRANAEIHQRRQYETRFKDLIANGRYGEALRLARLVIERFPSSPQADALRGQVPLLERRAAIET